MSSHQAPNSNTYHLYNSVRSPSILKKCGTKSVNNVSGRKVHFALFNDIKIMLLDYISNDEDKIYYNNLICDIRDSATEIKDIDLLKLLQDARNCINILNENLKLFVKVILILKWMNRSEEVVNEYRAFLIDVCTAHSYHTKFAIEQLVACFSYVDNADYDCVNGMPSEEEERGFQNVHKTLEALLKVIPLAKDVLMTAFQYKFPYKTSSTKSQLYYVHNLLCVTKYEPSLRKNIFSLVVKKLVEIDVHISKDELYKLESNLKVEIDNIFSMDVDEDNIHGNINKTKPECFSHTLDICLLRIFAFMKTTCHNIDDSILWDNTKLLYHDLLSVFENEILPIYNSSHIQYIIYYLLSFKMTLAENFANWLWRKCCDVSCPTTLRQASASYLASFLCRAPFVSNSILKNILSEISLWCNNYINRVDKSVKVVNEELLRGHVVFYSICQALFYIISFRHQDLMDSKRNLKFMENLSLSKIVTCRLSPLRLCCSTVVNHFAHITKIYQLTYCYAAMDGHIRITDQTIKDEWLYSFFPFGPYVLPRSQNLLIPDLYRNFEVDILNFSKTTKNNLHNVVSSLSDNNMDISPSMILSPSPGKIDWLRQFVSDSNKSVFY